MQALQATGSLLHPIKHRNAIKFVSLSRKCSNCSIGQLNEVKEPFMRNKTVYIQYSQLNEVLYEKQDSLYTVLPVTNGM